MMTVGIAPLSLNLNTRRRRVLSFRIRELFRQQNPP